MGTAALNDKRIVIAGSRKTDEMALIVEKQGGTPIIRSLQGLTMFEETALAEPLRSFAERGADWVILTTGMGSDSLVNTAERLGIKDEVLNALSKAKIATRGYKTSAFLKRNNFQAVVSDDDGTMQNLIENLDRYDFQGQRVWIQLHGEPAPELVSFLGNKGAAQVETVLPYRHVPPEAGALDTFMSDLAERAVDAVCFTTAVQVHYLFKYAKEAGLEGVLIEALEGPVVAGAVGKVTAQALKEYGVKRIIVPELERMGALIIELARYYEDAGR
ncbi:uroporphyrinogen-III synthase [Paenibacillus alkaliterrae]|uniref:uroporphyrinogen-III synthase n=1 Tax=Paenibacillus alkaliterrae TaxID=320909 RepID=UPI001F2DAFD1|nr:uroporphyrinogen-III synthase [Paenibacillus alkaliterrae]MCF2939803.1 uroporphyrinogen-III synthase [Paenibacillus alkaliterrae]